MFSPMFDGQYRSKPQVSLRGASKKEDRGNLLKRAHEERERRENVRNQHLAATVVQCHFRGYILRKTQHAELCKRFDQLYPLCHDVTTVLSLSHMLCPLYRESTDHERLIKLCQKWLHFRRDLASLASTDPSVTHHLLTLLTHSTNSLRSTPSQNLAVPLRMLEVFLDPSSYPEAHGSLLVSRLCRNLVARGYFTAMRHLLENRAPPPDGEDHAHSLLADSILKLLIHPLLRMGPEKELYKVFALDLFSRPLTPHLCYIILPHLMTFNLNLGRLLEAIRGVAVEGVASSLDLLYALIQLLHSRLKSLSQQLLADYFQVVAVLLGGVRPSEVTLHDVEDDDFDDVMSIDGFDEPDPLSSRDELLACCLNVLCGREIPNRIRQERSLSGPVINSLCSVCFQFQFSQLPLVTQARTVLFRQLALQPHILLPIWKSIAGITIERSFGGDSISALQQLARGVGIPPVMGVAIVERLTMFSILFNTYLSTLHDAEFFREIQGSQMPFSVVEVAKIVTQLRDLFVSLHFEKQLPHLLQRAHRDTKPSIQEWSCLKLSIHHLLCSLYERDCRRPFCPERHWESLHLSQIPPELFFDNQVGEEEGGVSVASPSIVKQAELLRAAPFVFPFEERVQFFTRLVASNRTTTQGHLQDFLLGPSIHVTARRDHIYEDAFAELAHGQDLRNKLRVTMVNAQGLDEPGIDGGGVFREFLNELLRTGFDPNRGYFTTTQDGQLYPNPQVHLFNDDFALHYQFLGGMLGKALYEGLLVELPFAGFFLCKLAGRGRGTVGVHHLASFDPELYRHLLSLKHYDGEIEELDLNFTLTVDDFGRNKVIELKPGGADISVTKENSIEYLHLVAHYKLNMQLEKQFQAFRRGLSEILPLHWLRLFSQNEFQVLISGAEMPINISDLRKNTAYSGEYKEDHPCIKMFWEVISSFTEKQKQQLLKFVTSCSRPPLLGFKELHPPFHISPGQGDVRLPSASTCMNVLKLPLYHDAETMKSKVLYAIQSGAGFELS